MMNDSSLEGPFFYTLSAAHIFVRPICFIKTKKSPKFLWNSSNGAYGISISVCILTSVRYKLVQIANLSFRWSVATKAAGLDNAGSKWSREAQTKFVPRGLRQGSIINESQNIAK